MKVGETVKDIGKIVREFRQNLAGGKVTQKKFGKLIGIPPSVVSDIENNKREPSKQVAKKLSELTGLPIETFLR